MCLSWPNAKSTVMIRGGWYDKTLRDWHHSRHWTHSRSACVYFRCTNTESNYKQQATSKGRCKAKKIENDGAVENKLKVHYHLALGPCCTIARFWAHQRRIQKHWSDVAIVWSWKIQPSHRCSVWRRLLSKAPLLKRHDMETHTRHSQRRGKTQALT